ncbi:hypothetical protein C5S30_02795 [ANME-1 cluster archaeon GoMg4]|nr:hypothetical protein [ANME-1 cluster archaeon GoMg4]
MTEDIGDTGARIIPEKTESKEDYLLYLKHLFAYEFASKTLSKDSIVLEVGCGEGYGTSFLSKSVKKIIGLDVDEQIVKHAQKKYGSTNCIFQVYNGKKIPFKENSFDAIISFQVIEHVQDDRSFVLEIYRILKQKGLFMLTTPNRTCRLKPEQKPWNPFHVREYYPYELENLLKSIFHEVQILGIRGKEEVQKIEINRVKPNPLISFDFLNLRRFLPDSIKKKLANIMNRRKLKTEHNDFRAKYSIEDFYVDDANQSLDIFGVCEK